MFGLQEEYEPPEILCKIWDIMCFGRRSVHKKSAANHHKVKTGKAICRQLSPEMLPVKMGDAVSGWRDGNPDLFPHALSRRKMSHLLYAKMPANQPHENTGDRRWLNMLPVSLLGSRHSPSHC